jgi:hypothetical protein
MGFWEEASDVVCVANTLDGYQAYHRAVREFSEESRRRRPIKVRLFTPALAVPIHAGVSIAIKSRTEPMPRFKDFTSARSWLHKPAGHQDHA